MLMKPSLPLISWIVRSALALALGSAASSAHAQLSLSPVGNGLDTPLTVTHAGDGSGRLFVAERAGRIRIIQGGNTLATPYLDVSALTDANPFTEGGLLGLAFHPDYRNNGYVFVLYSKANADCVVARYKVSANDPNVADPASASIVMTIGQGAGNHYGGALRFGPQDGHLYISVGDAASPANGQNLNTWRGKILRVNVDQLPYQVPSDNPFVASASPQREIWAYGMRNPWRMSFEPATGDLFVADVGGALEEINRIPRTQGGANLGWSTCIGDRLTTAGGEGISTAPCTATNHLAPIITYDHNNSDCAVIGGFVYRGGLAQLQGAYVFADHCTGRLFASHRSGPTTWGAKELLLTAGFNITSIGEDQNGELYISPFAAGTPLYRITSPTIFADGFE